MTNVYSIFTAFLQPCAVVDASHTSRVLTMCVVARMVVLTTTDQYVHTQKTMQML